MKKTLTIFTVIILSVIMASSLSLAAITCSETLTRSIPSSITSGQTFQVTYTAGATSGNWGVIIRDTVSGGCLFPAGTSYNGVLLSDEGATRTISVTAPASGTCTFSGQADFGDCAAKTLASASVSVCSNTCSSLGKQCGTWSVCGTNQNCGACTTGQQCSSTGICQTCNTPADLNCDNKVDLNELKSLITKWSNNQANLADLKKAITAWATG